jgi:hypothetical protein
MFGSDNIQTLLLLKKDSVIPALRLPATADAQDKLAKGQAGIQHLR